MAKKNTAKTATAEDEEEEDLGPTEPIRLPKRFMEQVRLACRAQNLKAAQYIVDKLSEVMAAEWPGVVDHAAKLKPQVPPK